MTKSALVVLLLLTACSKSSKSGDAGATNDFALEADAAVDLGVPALCDGDCLDLAPFDADTPPDLTMVDLSVGTCGSGAHTLVGDTNRPSNSTFVIGETITLTFKVTGTCSIVSLEIVDENNHVVADAALALESGTAMYTAPSKKLGYYRVNATLADGTTPVMLGTRPAGFITYAVVPDPSRRTDYGDVLSRFGMQGGFSAAQGAVIPFMGLRWVLGTPNWTSLEPTMAGQLAADLATNKYPPTAPVVDAVTYNGKPWNTYELGQITSAKLPSWAGPVAGTAGNICTTFGALNAAGVSGLPGFATAYAQYFSQTFPKLTKRFYQVTWEPETPWCFDGTSAQLAQYYSLVYANIHKADPNAQVMGPTIFYGDATELTGLYTAGMGTSLDAFSIHPYVAWPFETTAFIADIRAQMAQANTAAGKTVPFFGTEHGLTSGSIGELNQALGNIREEIALIGEGFIHDYSFYIADFWDKVPTETANTYGFYWNLDPNIDYGTDKVGPKPAVPAFAALTYFLDGSTSKGQLTNTSGTQLGYRFTRGGDTTLALWDYKTTSTITLTTPIESVQLCDWMGNCSTLASQGSVTLTLGASPAYLIGANL